MIFIANKLLLLTKTLWILFFFFLLHKYIINLSNLGQIENKKYNLKFAQIKRFAQCPQSKIEFMLCTIFNINQHTSEKKIHLREEKQQAIIFFSFSVNGKFLK